MTKDEIRKKFIGGISVEDRESPYGSVDWIFDEREQKDDFIQLIGYDANMYPLPNMSKWKNKEWVKENIDKVLSMFQDYNIEVWLDDVKIKDKV